MSEMGPKTFRQSDGHFRSCPLTGHSQCQSACLKRAKSGSHGTSLRKSGGMLVEPADEMEQEPPDCAKGR